MDQNIWHMKNKNEDANQLFSFSYETEKALFLCGFLITILIFIVGMGIIEMMTEISSF